MLEKTLLGIGVTATFSVVAAVCEIGDWGKKPSIVVSVRDIGLCQTEITFANFRCGGLLGNSTEYLGTSRVITGVFCPCRPDA
jgi:hypothetical protein